MPYEAYKDGDQWCVRNEKTGEVKDCFESEEGANRYMAALYAAEPEMEKSDSRPERLFKADEERHLIYGVVAEPETLDSYGDWLTADEIERACHAFMRQYQAVGLEHEVQASSCRVVESYIAPADFEIGDQTVRRGSWMMVTHVDASTAEGAMIWRAVKAGGFTGYSFQGFGRRRPGGPPA